MENRWTSSNRTNRPKEVNPKLEVRKVRNQPADAPQVQEQITLVTLGRGEEVKQAEGKLIKYIPRSPGSLHNSTPLGGSLYPKWQNQRFGLWRQGSWIGRRHTSKKNRIVDIECWPLQSYSSPQLSALGQTDFHPPGRVWTMSILYRIWPSPGSPVGDCRG